MSAPWIVLAAIVTVAAVYVLLPVVGAVFVHWPGQQGCDQSCLRPPSF